MRAAFTVLLLSGMALGQAWSGILPSNRALDWTTSGLPATLPSGETTANAWTPPTRTQCGTTITAGASVATINAAISACASGHYVLLGTGAFTINATLQLYGTGVTLRGSGYATKLTLTANLNMGAGSPDTQAGTALLTSAAGNYTQGTTSLTVNTTTLTPTTNTVVGVRQCDTGVSASPFTCAGTPSDVRTDGIFICAEKGICNIDDAPSGSSSTLMAHQEQLARVTAVSDLGGVGAAHAYQLTISPGLAMPNWEFARTPWIEWDNQTSSHASAMGLENMTLYIPYTSTSVLQIQAYASWVTGVRVIGSPAGDYPVASQGSHRILFANNYIVAIDPASTTSLNSGNAQGAFLQTRQSGNLVLNNIITYGFAEADGFTSGNIWAYNYLRDAQGAAGIGFLENAIFEHMGSPNFILYEGNQSGILRDDDTWGTHTFDTFFRNYASCYDTPFSAAGNGTTGIEVDAFARYENVIGNVVGTTGNPSYACTSYEAAADGAAFKVNFRGAFSSDTLTASSLTRWGNYDTVTGHVRWCTGSSTDAFGAAAWCTANERANGTSFYPALTSPSTTLPASFFLGATAHPSGGTGLNWWKVCTNFPTCSTFQTQPFPPAGPDVTGGLSAANGFAYDNPAATAWKNLPIDTSFQNSYSITSSSWSGGTETLTVSGLPTGTRLMGGFSVVTGACAGGEFLMTNSSSTQIMYALAGNPGSCAGGSVKWPNIRQFDSGVYANDAASSTYPHTHGGGRTLGGGHSVN